MDTIVWQPNHPEQSHMWQFMRFVEQTHLEQFTDYQQLHTWSIQYPAQFWQAVLDFFQIELNTPADAVLTPAPDMINTCWFQGATFNFAQKLLSRSDAHPALISIDEDGHRHVITYQELHHQVAMCAAGLKHAGIMKGDRVVAIMPNVAHTIIAMLATTSMGAIWSSCSPDFGANALVDRLSQIEPKLVFVCDGQRYHGKTHDTLDKIREISHHLPTVQQLVICPVLHHDVNPKALRHAILWDAFLKPSVALTFPPMPFDHPVYILFSSGTTGKPKCIVHGAGGTLLQHIKELGLHTDLKAEDNLCFYTTCGWMMWNWMVSSLALGATLTLYEGSPTYPDASRLFQLLEDEQVSIFGTSAKFISSIEKSGYQPASQFNLPHLRSMLSTGSPLLPPNYDFVYQHIKANVQLASISGGTDIISCFALGNPILPVYRGELQSLGLGMSVAVYSQQGESIIGARGELVCTKPFPSMPVGFWNDADKVIYQHTYFERFPGIWTHGDFAEITPHHGLIIYGRSDTTLNPGGVRIGTAEIYRQIETIPEIMDCVVIGQPWQDDVRVVLFVQLHTDVNLNESLKMKITQTIKTHASPRHVPQKILQVNDIPRTLSGKIVEIAVRQAVIGEPILNIDSIANPIALNNFKNRDELRD